MNTRADKKQGLIDLFNFMVENSGKHYIMFDIVKSFKVPSTVTTYLLKNNLIKREKFDGNRKTYTFIWDGSMDLIDKCISVIDECNKDRSIKCNELRRKKFATRASPDFLIDRFVMNMY